VQRAEEEQLLKKSKPSAITSRKNSKDSMSRQATGSAGRNSSTRSVGGVNVGIGSIAAGEVKPEDARFVSEASATDGSNTGSPAACNAPVPQGTTDGANGQLWCSKEQNAAKLFKQLDKDGDGIITQSELAAAFRKGLLGTASEQALPARPPEKHSARSVHGSGRKHGPDGKERSRSASSTRSVGSTSSGHGRPSSKEIMPFRKQRLQRQDAFSRRKSVTCMEGYLDGAGADAVAASAAGASEQDFCAFAPSSIVVRGRDWKWGNEDGGAGKTGTVVSSNESTKTIAVNWESSGKTFDHYRCNTKMDLALASTSSAPARFSRKSTQHLFADPSQTFIVFDWDDTLFPTTYIRDDLNLCWQTPVKNQRLPSREKNEISKNLQRCSDLVCSLLEDACISGKVVLVTLARSPWVTTSCDNFYPAVGDFIKAMGIPVVYAQESEEVDYDKIAMSSDVVVENHWARVKGRAIAKLCQEFYSQYAGQSWKNIISIGDSDFERLGTRQATQDYMRLNGIKRSRTVEVKGHVYKVRTKTFKMLDQPTVEELAVELALVQKWLPLMTGLDNSFDVNLSDLEDPALLYRIERTLQGGVFGSGRFYRGD